MSHRSVSTVFQNTILLVGVYEGKREVYIPERGGVFSLSLSLTERWLEYCERTIDCFFFRDMRSAGSRGR